MVVKKIDNDLIYKLLDKLTDKSTILSIDDQINVAFETLFPNTDKKIQNDINDICVFFDQEGNNNGKLDVNDFILIKQKIEKPVFATIFFTTISLKCINLHNSIKYDLMNVNNFTINDFTFRTLMYIMFMSLIYGSEECADYMCANKQDISATLNTIYRTYQNFISTSDSFKKLESWIKGKMFSCICANPASQDEINQQISDNSDILKAVMKNN